MPAPFQDYSAKVQEHVESFYRIRVFTRAGEKRDFGSFWLEGTPLIQPKPVPHFTPTRRTFRLDGVVI